MRDVSILEEPPWADDAIDRVDSWRKAQAAPSEAPVGDVNTAHRIAGQNGPLGDLMRPVREYLRYAERMPVGEGLVDLNVGCGTRPLLGYVNADILPGKGVDVVFDLTENWPFADGLFREVHANHVVEHLPQVRKDGRKDAFVHFVEESHRVLMPGGRLHIRVPYHKLPPYKFYANPTHYRYVLPQNFNAFLGATGTCVARLSEARFKKMQVRVNRELPLGRNGFRWHLERYLGIGRRDLRIGKGWETEYWLWKG